MFFICLDVFLCGYVLPDLSSVTAPVLSVKESQKKWQLPSFSHKVFVSSLSVGAETPAGALEGEQLGNYNMTSACLYNKITSLGWDFSRHQTSCFSETGCCLC